jgi:FKBP-type peptidyl-prolyl cis-trans isomerase
VLILKILLSYAIPESPNNLRVQLQRERQTQREVQFQQDQRRAQSATQHRQESQDVDENSHENSNVSVIAESILGSSSSKSSLNRRIKNNSVSPV